MSKKTALEQALLESDEIIKVVTNNAKDMLYAQLKPEIDKTIKESLELDDDDSDLDDTPNDTPPVDDITTIDKSGEGAPEDEVTIDDKPDGEVSIDSEPELGSETAPEDDEIDLTGASDDEVIKVFKKLSDDSEIKIVKTEDGIEIEKDGEEFLVKLNEVEDFSGVYTKKPTMAEDKMGFVDSIEENSSEDDEIIYEIVMDEDDTTGVESQVGSPETENKQEPTLDEVARTHADGHRQLRKPEGFYKYAASRIHREVSPSQPTVNEEVKLDEGLVKTNKSLITENENLKKDLDAHKNALRSLKENLMEVALVNSQMAYVNRLFCEHATTLAEKKAVIDRFSEVKTIDESKMLFKTISNEMKNIKVSIQEEVENKINTNINSTGQPLLEQVAPSEGQQQIDRVKFLMGYNVVTK